MIVLSHRGRHAGNTHPDNTLAALAGAVRAGIAGVEVDVRATRDGEAVLFHDGRPKRGGRRVGSMTRLELSRAVRHDVPTLAEAFALLPGALFDVELKSRDALDAAEPTLAAADRARVFVTSFVGDVVAAASLRLGLRCGLILARAPRRLDRPPWARFRADERVRTLVLPLERIAQRLVEVAHRDGFEVLAWRVRNAAHRRRAAELGLDGIIVDA